MARESKRRPAADAELPPILAEEAVGLAAGPAQQGLSPGLPPIPKLTGAAASSSTTEDVKWPKAQTEPEQAPRGAQIAPAD